MRTGNSLGNRLVALTLSIIMVLGMFPTGVAAIETTDIYGAVESLSEGVSITGSGAEIKATYAGTLKWVAANEAAGRNADGWWVGVKMTAPQSINLEEAMYTSGGQERRFKEYNDSADDASVQFIELWGLVNEEYLRSANQTDGLSTYTWTFDWDGDKTYEQTLILDIDADQTVLLDKDGTKVYPAVSVGNGSVTQITEGGKVSNQGSTATVEYSGLKLEWSAQDPSAGRMQDGWWAGIQITAPSQMTKEADFANVTYQRYENGAWSAAKSFWNAQDSDKNTADTARYLTLWGLITPELIQADNDGILTYQWRFDWNQDGIYEQNLLLKVDGAAVTLMKNGVQQFPLRYGQAQSLSGGTAVGSGTAACEVIVNNGTLTWETADPAVGRAQDGWWIGAKITAPADMTKEADFTNVTYQRYENGTWSAAKSFWSAQDSDKNTADTARYLTLWGLITPELIQADNDGILTYQWRFDWNQDGKYEQLLTMKADPENIVLLDKNGVQVYPALGEVIPLTEGAVTGSGTGNAVVRIENASLTWAEADPAAGRGQDGWWTGIKVKAPAGTVTENIKFRRKTADGWTAAMSYKPDDGTQDTMQLWGLVTAEYLQEFSKANKNLNYVWQFSWDGDDVFEQTVTMTVVPDGITLKQAGFDFVQKTDEITYAEDYKYPIIAPVGGQSGEKPVYTVDDTDVATVNDDGTLTILKAGDVTITATLSGAYYEDITASYTLSVKKAEQAGFGIDNPPAQVTWQEKPLDSLGLVNGLSTGPVTWSVEGESDVASVDADGNITLLKAGTFTLQVQKAGDECYNDSALVSTTIEVLPADQTGFGFASESDTVTYNDVDKNAAEGTGIVNQYTLKASGGQSSSNVVTYTVVDGDAATVEGNVLSIHRAGTVTIKATKEGDDQYKETAASFVLTIALDSQEFSFKNGKEVNLIYGTTEYENDVVYADRSSQSTELIYEISENEIGAAVDKATGKVTFSDSVNKVGSATVTVVKPGDACYDAYSESYTLTVSYLETEAKPVPDGDKLNDSGWFTGNVKIVAPTGYQISTDNSISTDWASYVSFNEEGADKTAKVYLRDGQGYITDAVYVEGIYTDTVAPGNLTISYAKPAWAVVWENVTFGLYKADKLLVTVSAEDTNSGISQLIYNYGEGDVTIPVNAVASASSSFEIKAQHRNNIVLKAVDVSGRSTVLKDETVIVLDKQSPVVDAEYEFASGSHRDSNGVYYTQQDVTVKFTISEENFDLSGLDIVGQSGIKTGMPIVKVNGQEEVLTWNRVGQTTEWITELTLSSEGDYVISLEYTDPANNALEEPYEQQIHIDRTAPVISVEYDNNEAQNEKYYNANRTASITITEHDFMPEEVVLTVTARNVRGPVDVSSKDYGEYARNPANWTNEGDVWTLKQDGLVFDVDAIYNVELSYTDLAGRPGQTYSEEFVIDHKAPEIVKIEYSQPVVTNILENLFFYQKAVTVTVTAEDITAGAEYVELTYTKEDGTSQTNAQSFTTQKLAVVQDQTQMNVFTATYTIPAQARGTVSAYVMDLAGNDSSKGEQITLVVDDKDPTRTVSYAPYKILDKATMNEVSSYTEGDNAILYYKDKAEVTFQITEANFDLSLEDGAAPEIRVNNQVVEVTDWTQDGDTWTGHYTITGDGDYVVTMAYTDLSTNEMEEYTSCKIVIDSKNPEVTVKYEDNVDTQTIDGTKYFNTNQTAKITVKEKNFRADDVRLTVTAENILGEPVDISGKDYAGYAKNRANWSFNGEAYELNTAGMVFDIDAIYTFDIVYDDICDNDAVYNVGADDSYATDYPTDSFVIDHEAPTNLRIDCDEAVAKKIVEQLTFGLVKFFKDEVVVTVTAEDITSGVDYIELTYTKDDGSSDINCDTFTTEPLKVTQDAKNKNVFTATYTIPAYARGTVSARVVDKAGKDSSEDKDALLVVDNKSPERTVEYKPYKILDAATMLEVDTYTEGDNSILYYKDEAVVTFKITEANFDLSLLEGTASQDDTTDPLMKEGAQEPEIKVNGETVVVDDWTKNGDTWTGRYTITGDGDYVVTMAYTDLSTNEMEEYTSCKIAIDSEAPKVKAEYKDGAETQTIDGTKYYKTTQTAQIQITEHNFRADEVELTVTAENILQKSVDIFDYKSYAKDRANWTNEGDVWSLNTEGMVFDTDAIYTFDIVYDDICDNDAVYNVGADDSYVADYPADRFVVDHEDPYGIKIEYSQAVVEKIIEKLTFGFYKADVTVTVTAEDMTAGVDYFELIYTRDEKATDAHAADFKEILKAEQSTADAKLFTASYTVDAEMQARGSFSVNVFDCSGKSSDEADPDTVIVTDTISPEVQISFAAKDQNTVPRFVDSNLEDVTTFAEAASAYYNGSVVTTITVDEANFFEGKASGENDAEIVHEFVIKVTRTDDQGKQTVTEYLCDGAKQLVTGADTKTIEWNTDGDTHTASFELVDDGDYVVEVSYVDFSEQKSNLTGNDGTTAKEAYRSKVITVDTVKPAVKVQYTGTQIVNTVDVQDSNGQTVAQRAYYEKAEENKPTEVVPHITVTEHNFRADDIVLTVTAHDYLGNPVDISTKAYADYAKTRANWNAEGDVHTLNTDGMVFDIDANYTFDISYEDLARNAAVYTAEKLPDYPTDYFAVDTQVPTDLKISYSDWVNKDKTQTQNAQKDPYYYREKVTVTITAKDETAGVKYFTYKYTVSEGVSSVNAGMEKADTLTAVYEKGSNGVAKATFEIPKEALTKENQFNGTIEFTAHDFSENTSALHADGQQIVVDNISPKANISYNTPVQIENGISYYNGSIEATITVNEANFYSDDVVVTVTKDGASYPVNVRWTEDTTKQDTHIGRFVLSQDGDYIVSVTYTDRSGNRMDAYKSNELTLDTTKPEIKVSNIKANSANKDEQYGFVIEVSDTNLDAASIKPVLKAVVKNEQGVYETVEIKLGEPTAVVAGQSYTYTVENLEADGLYTLTCEAKDMSYNSMAQILLEDGKTYDKVQFSINRNGSVFGYGAAYTQKLVERYYVYSVDDHVVIEEINVDPIENYTVTLNGKELTEGTDFTTEQTSKIGEWSKRTYTIHKDLFAAEGAYNIIVSSTDKAETTVYSDVKNLALAFVVDQTKPVLTITGLTAGGRYQTDVQTVTLIPTDEGGRLNDLSVVVLDSDGKPLKDANGEDISVRFSMSGEELLKHLEENDGKITFTIPEGLNNQVKIICNDCAINADNLTNEYNELFDRVTVSQNQLVIFYANKPLFYGTVAGVLALIALIVILIKRKKDKGEKKDNKVKAKT